MRLSLLQSEHQKHGNKGPLDWQESPFHSSLTLYSQSQLVPSRGTAKSLKHRPVVNLIALLRDHPTQQFWVLERGICPQRLGCL